MKYIEICLGNINDARQHALSAATLVLLRALSGKDKRLLSRHIWILLQNVYGYLHNPATDLTCI